ncbi:MAG: sodium:proton exchanger [Sphingomonadales bacterium]|nr:sodium:proton exchanger [Sphingomonadales bacterium]
MYLRLTGWRPNPVLDAAVFGVAVLAAGFMLSWGAEAAESRVSQGLMLACLALVTVLPEYAVDIYYAWRAGQTPGSDYIHYAAANMTGANRLLVGLGWPLIVFLNWWKRRESAVALFETNKIELFFLVLASAYAFVILFKNRIDLFDFVALLAIFGGYMWRVSRLSKPDAALGDSDDDEGEELGPAAILETLTPRLQWAWTAGLTMVAGAIILLSAEPFAESMVGAGRALGIDEFLLIQWVAPLTGESPEILLAILFVMAARPGSGLIALISDKINQWTLLVGALPVAMSVGAGSLVALPLSARQHEEFFLTAAQSLFGIALLLRLRLGLRGAFALATLFAIQVVLAFVFQRDPVREITALTTLGWIYLILALGVFAMGLPGLLRRSGAGSSSAAA